MVRTVADSTAELAILCRVVDPDEPYFSGDAAKAILRLSFAPADRKRMNQLAEKNRAGQLTDDENRELDNFIRVGQTLGVLQSKVRRTLKKLGE